MFGVFLDDCFLHDGDCFGLNRRQSKMDGNSKRKQMKKVPMKRVLIIYPNNPQEDEITVKLRMISELLKQSDNDDEIFRYLCEEIQMKGKSLSQMKKKEYSVLHEALIYSRSSAIVFKLVEIGGRELVMERDTDGDTVLYTACANAASIEVVSKLIEIGGRELIMSKGMIKGIVLHTACENKASVEVISKLIEIGGRELVMAKCGSRNTALHTACANKAPMQVISKLIEVGGRDLLMEKTYWGDTVLHYIFRRYEASIEVISRLIEAGGRELIMEKTNRGDNILHYALRYKASIEVVTKLIEVGGHELLLQKNKKGSYPLYAYFEQKNSMEFGDTFAFIIKECISTQIGGEFGIGGLFNIAPDDVKDEIYDTWEQFAPYLEKVIVNLQPPILQAVIIAKAPRGIIIDSIHRFRNISIRDSFNRCPIDVAVEEGLDWSEGMLEMMETISAEQKRPSIHVAAQYGLQWGNYMKELVTSNIEEVVYGFDNGTGLRLFMLAAMGNNSDLSTIYGMMRMSP